MILIRRLIWQPDCHIRNFTSPLFNTVKQPASVARLDALPTGDRKLWGRPPPGRQHFCVETDHEIFSTVILSLPLIQEGSCYFLAKEYAQYWLTA